KKDAEGDAEKERLVLGGLNAAEGDGGELFFRGEDRQLKEVRQLYRKLDPTREWAENNYYHLRTHQQLADLVSVSPFWHDYAKHDGNGPFVSRHLADASRNFTEMAFALPGL